RMHLERGKPDEEAWTGERRLVLLVIADDVAHVLAEEALDALVEFLYSVDVLLIHPPLAVGVLRLRFERRDRLGLLVVEGDIGHEVFDARERSHWRDCDRLPCRKLAHPRHAHELRRPIHFGAA